MPAVSTNGRDSALDAFRGLAVLGMVLVNLQGSGPVAFAAWSFRFFCLPLGSQCHWRLTGARERGCS